MAKKRNKNQSSNSKYTRDLISTMIMVVAIYIVVQILISAGIVSSLMQGLLVPMCQYHGGKCHEMFSCKKN